MKIEDYECTIDYLDLAEANVLPLLNEKAASSNIPYV